ncbi:hypothetical protein ACWATR_08440 [Nostoc sp. UIC 10890]
MQNSRIRYEESLPPASKPVALYFMQKKTEFNRLKFHFTLRMRIPPTSDRSLN